MVSKILYALLVIGIYLIFSDSINYLFKDILVKFRKLNALTNNGRFKIHIEKIFIVISKENMEKRDVNIFYISTILIFLITFYYLVKSLDGVGVILSITLSLLPYAYIRTKLILLQRSGSFEGEALLREIFTQYKTNERNIITTIDETVQHLSSEEHPVTKRALFRVSLKIKSIKGEEELKEVLALFNYCLNTKWSKTLSENFYSAIWEKVDVYTGLNDLYASCKRINRHLEKNKRENMESMGMVKYLGPFFMIFFAYLAASVLSIKQIILYQFTYSTGILLFCLIAISIIFGGIFINLLSKQKYDW